MIKFQIIGISTDNDVIKPDLKSSANSRIFLTNLKNVWRQSKMEQTRYDKGIKTLEKITGSSVEALLEGLKEMSPELVDWMVAFSYSDVLSRTNLDLRTRQLATVAALTAMGTAPLQLKFHINGALNVGCKQDEIIEVILQMAVYAGFPAAINGILAAKEVFTNRKAT
jgi:4-carboxymuconolactone decarboxylase